MSWYRHRVERDLARWQTAGWVNEAGAAALRTDLQSRALPVGVAPIFAILGARPFRLAVALTRSNPALAATFVLLVVWTSYERGLSSVAHWSFLPAWAAAAAAAAWLGWRPGLHLAAISLVAWLVPLGYFVLDHHAHWIVV